MTTVAELPAGFADKVLSAQSTFRSVMDAMARPGSVQRIVATAGMPAPMMRGTAAIALTLFDHDTPLWLDPLMSETSEVTKWLKFHTGAPVIDEFLDLQFCADRRCARASRARSFCVRQQRISRPFDDADPAGRKPDARSALELRGPGIDGTAVLQATIQPADLFERLEINRTLFPRGIDVVLVADDAIVAIPRTTRLVAKGG